MRRSYILILGFCLAKLKLVINEVCINLHPFEKSLTFLSSPFHIFHLFSLFPPTQTRYNVCLIVKLYDSNKD